MQQVFLPEVRERRHSRAVDEVGNSQRSGELSTSSTAAPGLIP